MRIHLLALLWLFLLAPTFAQASPTASDVRASLEEGVKAWNRGDLDGFMKGYVHTSEMTFTAGGRLVRGYEELQKRYVKTYGKSRESMGQLRFDEIEVTPLGDNNALAVGKWSLDMMDKNLKKETLGGIFSLVMRKTADGWLILHDHTSREEKDKEKKS